MDLEEARRLAQMLVEERVVACAQIIPSVESIYVWNDKIESSRECKVVLKTLAGKFGVVKGMIQKFCSYDVPEITAVAISQGNSEYLNWMREVLCE